MTISETREVCPAERELKAGMLPRVSVSKSADHIKKTFIHTNIREPFPFADLGSNYTREAATELYNNRKDERFGLLAIFNSVVIDRVLENRKGKFAPYGMVKYEGDDKFSVQKKIDPAGPNSDIFLGVAWACDVAAQQVVIEADRGKTSKYLKRTIDRLREWQIFADKNLSKKGNVYSLGNNDVYGFQPPFDEDEGIIGAPTAALYMTSLIMLIPEKAYEEMGPSGLDPDLLREIAVNSYSLIASIAMLDHYTNDAIDFALFGLDAHTTSDVRGIQAKDIELVRGKNGLGLRLRNEVWEKGHEVMKEKYPDGIGETKRGGCPAMVYDSIKKLWTELFIPVGYDYYKMHLGGNLSSEN